MSELAKALAAFQAEMPVVAKNRTATVPTKSGGQYSYSYADLADITRQVLPLLLAHGLVFTCMPVEVGEGLSLTGQLIHVESDEKLTGTLPLYGRTAQEIGSSITYARRYLLGCLTGVVTDVDDDGQTAQDKPRARKATRRPEPPAPPEGFDPVAEFSRFADLIENATTLTELAAIATEIAKSPLTEERDALRVLHADRMQALS